MRPLLMLITNDVHRMEYDPDTQYRFNQVATWFWVLCMVGIPFVPSFRSNLLGLLIMEASLWANAATHFGAMSAALAAKQTKPNNLQTPQISTDSLSQKSKTEQRSYSKSTNSQSIVSVAHTHDFDA